MNKSKKLSSISSLDIKKVFIVGNGPSLKHFNFKNLKNSIWIGMNAAYRYWNKVGIFPTYYACLDINVGLSHRKEIIKMVESSTTNKIQLFLLRDELIKSSEVLKVSSQVISYDQTFKNFPERIVDYVTTGSHSLLWMYMLGYKEFILLGIDLNYQEVTEGSKKLGIRKRNKLKIYEDNKSINYFFDGYQKKGDVYTVPNPIPDLHKIAWSRIVLYINYLEQDLKIFNTSDLSTIPKETNININNIFTTQKNSEHTNELSSDISINSDNILKESLLIIKKSNLYSLSALINELVPLYYSPVILQDKSYVEYFKNWPIRYLGSVQVNNLSGVFLEDYFYKKQTNIEGCGFLIIKITSLNNERLKERLYASFDSLIVLRVSESGRDTIIKSDVTLEVNDFVIALSKHNFSIERLRSAYASTKAAGTSISLIYIYIRFFMRKFRLLLKYFYNKIRL
jgi:hypothetical protein